MLGRQMGKMKKEDKEKQKDRKGKECLMTIKTACRMVRCPQGGRIFVLFSILLFPKRKSHLHFLGSTESWPWPSEHQVLS